MLYKSLNSFYQNCKIFLLFLLLPSLLSAYDQAPYHLFSGTSNPHLAERVAEYLGVELSPIQISRFNDGEIRIKIDQNVRNSHVFLLQSTCTTDNLNVNDSLIELFLMIRAMKRASVKQVTAIIPYYGYARQDRKTESRVPISASDIAMLLEHAGADHVISVDLHCGQIQGFFHKAPVDNLFASKVFVQYLAAKTDLIDPVIISPDAGGVERAKKFLEGLGAKGIEAGLAVIVKQRAEAGVIDKMNLVGTVDGCDAIIVDDICDTAGTLVQAAKELKKQGARRVFACITHPVFSGLALERIGNSCLTELVVADTIPEQKDLPPNVVTLSVAPLIAEAVLRTYNGWSSAHLFN